MDPACQGGLARYVIYAEIASRVLMWSVIASSASMLPPDCHSEQLAAVPPQWPAIHPAHSLRQDDSASILRFLRFMVRMLSGR